MPDFLENGTFLGKLMISKAVTRLDCLIQFSSCFQAVCKLFASCLQAVFKPNLVTRFLEMSTDLSNH